MKNLKYLLMVIMIVALIMVASACKTQEPDPELDDIQFVSWDVKVDQFDGFAKVSISSVVRVKTFATTRVIEKVYFDSKDSGMTVDVPSTGGEWVIVSIPTMIFALYSGTYEIKAEFTLESNGKVVTSPTIQVIVH